MTALMSGTLALTVVDLAIVWLVPIGFFLALWLLGSLVVYLAIRSPLDFDFKHDLIRKFEEKRRLPSGSPRLSYGLVAGWLAGDNCIQAAFLYRVSRFFVTKGLRPLARVVHAFSKLVTHADISPWSSIGPGLYLYHGMGVVIGKGTTIGERALICQGVTTGKGPTLGDDVKLWAGAKVIGRVTVGDRSEVGANAVVISDVPADCIAVGVPATRFLPREEKAAAARVAEVVAADG
jgi:serine acetyltransferase